VAIDRFEEGIILLHTDRFVDAVQLFKELVEKDPSNAAAWEKLAVSYLGSGLLEESEMAAEKALELNPKNPDVLALLGGMRSLKGNNDEALSYFDLAIAVKPDHTRSWISKVTTLRALKREEDAKDAYREGVEKDTKLNDPENWNDLAGAIYDDGKFQETIEFFDFMLELEPDEVSYKFNKLAPLSKMKKYEDVVTLAGEIAEQNPDFLPAWMVKGISLLALRRHEEALKCFDQAVKLDPANNEALNMRAKIQHYLDTLETTDKSE